MKKNLNNDFEKVRGLFPLTPALSLGERGKCFQRLGELQTVSGSTDYRRIKNVQLLFPLPWGEGQGEGEGDVISQGHILPEPTFNPGATP